MLNEDPGIKSFKRQKMVHVYKFFGILGMAWSGKKSHEEKHVPAPWTVLFTELEFISFFLPNHTKVLLCQAHEGKWQPWGMGWNCGQIFTCGCLSCSVHVLRGMQNQTAKKYIAAHPRLHTSPLLSIGCRRTFACNNPFFGASDENWKYNNQQSAFSLLLSINKPI